MVKKKEKKVVENKKEELFNSFLYLMADFQTRNPILTLFIIIAITLIFIGGLSGVKTVASLEKMMPLSTPEVKYFNLLRDEFAGKDSLAVTISLDKNSQLENPKMTIFDYETLKYIYDLENEIKKNSKITYTISISDYLVMYNYLNFGEEEFPSKENYYLIISNDQFQPIINNFINYNLDTTMIVATTDVGTIDEQMLSLANKLSSQIESFGHPKGIKVTLTGSPILQQTLGNLINKDKVVTFTLAAIFIFLALLFTFKSFIQSITPLLIVVIAAIWLYGTMGYFNIPISTLAGGVASMVMGIGIAYSIHILNRYKLERAEGKLISQATDLAVVNTGFAVIATSATTLVAFFAFVFGQMPEMGRFGILMVIGIFYTMILSLFGLPAILILEEKIRIKLAEGRK
jgi:hypothetical protein